MKKKIDLNPSELTLYQSNQYYNVEIYQDRKEWLNSRLGCIGASEASCILDKNPYKSKEQFIQDKLKGEIKESQKGVLKYGQDNENIIRQLFIIDYRTKYKLEYCNNVNVFSVKYPFLSCSPDSLLLEIGRKMKSRKGILEIKTAYVKNEAQLSEWNKTIPIYYYAQILHQLLVMEDLDFVVLRAKIKVYDRFTKEYYYLIKDYFIERSDVQEDIDYLLKKELEFVLEQRYIDFKAITDEFTINLCLTLENQ